MKKLILAVLVVAVVLVGIYYVRNNEDAQALYLEYKATIESQLTDLGNQIQKLEDKLKAGGGDPGLERQLDELKRQKKTITKKLEEFKASGSESWSQFKATISGLMKKLQQQFEATEEEAEPAKAATEQSG